MNLDFLNPQTKKEESSKIDYHDNYKLIVESDIKQVVINAVLDKYTDIIDNRKAEVKQKVSTYLSSDEGLEYRHLNPDKTFNSWRDLTKLHIKV